MIDPDSERASGDVGTIKRILYWVWIAVCLVCGAVLIGLCAPARAETMTFVLSTPCQQGKVVHKGNDIIIRCGDKQWLEIKNANLSCPGVKATRDAQGNLTVRCP